jgi:hypothetical protein
MVNVACLKPLFPSATLTLLTERPRLTVMLTVAGSDVPGGCHSPRR